ncbi:MAG: hypothetical protein ACREO2_12020, partial [Arenimonas sp.]
DALGAVTKTTYDADGRAITVRAYATAIVVSDLTTMAGVTASVIKSRVDAVANDALDQVRYQIYDRDSRVRFSVDAMGDVTETRYDTAGRVAETLAYTTALSSTDLTTVRSGTATVSTFAAFLAQRVTLVWDNGFDNTAQTGFSNLGWVFPNVVNGEAEFSRDPAIGSSRALILSSDIHSYLNDNVTYSSELRIDSNATGTFLEIGIQNQADYLSAGFLRDAIMVQDGVLYRHQYAGATETKTPLLTMVLGTTYIVETETAGDHVTTYVYAKGSERSSGTSFTRQTTSATYGSTMWYAYGEQHPGVSGGTVFVDNISSTTRANAQVQANRYDAAGRLIRSLD